MYYIYLTLFVLTFNAVHASIYSNLKQNVLSLLSEAETNKGDSAIPKRRNSMRYFNHIKQLDEEDRKKAQEKANVLRSVRALEEDLNKGRDNIALSQFTRNEDILGLNGGRNKPFTPKPLEDDLDTGGFRRDPVLNDLMMERFGMNARRSGSSSDSSESTSSSSGENFWMHDWEEHWMKKKFEALNSSMPRGDVVNMVAARPWGVACGDPNQHDMPWGTCMLPAECDSEYRIYRGDYFCGRTAYICCALLATNYDMYQGLDVSFEASSFETDESDRKLSKKLDEKKKRNSKKKKRKKERERRKKNIQKSIRRIIREIKNILTKAYKNGTAQRKKKTKELKRFIDMMKKQYKKDRKAVVNVHEFELGKVDEKLQSKLNHIQGVNEAFMGNDTFSDIVVNGTVNKENLQRFLRAHPELANYFQHRRTGFNPKPNMKQKSKSENIKRKKVKRKPKLLDYDVEYGMLYY